jgi:hypothetical protein
LFPLVIIVKISTWRVAPAMRALASEIAHPATTATIGPAALAPNKVLLPLEVLPLDFDLPTGWTDAIDFWFSDWQAEPGGSLEHLI